MDGVRFENTIKCFDLLNETDPNTEEVMGEVYPKELLYARRMTEQLMAFCPEASEELQLAARAQHISRWSIPRSEYPMTKSGYKQWRNALSKFHAETAGRIMYENGYDGEAVSRVEELIQKRRLTSASAGADCSCPKLSSAGKKSTQPADFKTSRRLITSDLSVCCNTTAEP